MTTAGMRIRVSRGLPCRRPVALAHPFEAHTVSLIHTLQIHAIALTHALKVDAMAVAIAF